MNISVNYEVYKRLINEASISINGYKNDPSLYNITRDILGELLLEAIREYNFDAFRYIVEYAPITYNNVLTAAVKQWGLSALQLIDRDRLTYFLRNANRAESLILGTVDDILRGDSNMLEYIIDNDMRYAKEKSKAYLKLLIEGTSRNESYQLLLDKIPFSISQLVFIMDDIIETSKFHKSHEVLFYTVFDEDSEGYLDRLKFVIDRGKHETLGYYTRFNRLQSYDLNEAMLTTMINVLIIDDELYNEYLYYIIGNKDFNKMIIERFIGKKDKTLILKIAEYSLSQRNFKLLCHIYSWIENNDPDMYLDVDRITSRQFQ